MLFFRWQKSWHGTLSHLQNNLLFYLCLYTSLLSIREHLKLIFTFIFQRKSPQDLIIWTTHDFIFDCPIGLNASFNSDVVSVKRSTEKVIFSRWLNSVFLWALFSRTITRIWYAITYIISRAPINSLTTFDITSKLRNANVVSKTKVKRVSKTFYFTLTGHA